MDCDDDSEMHRLEGSTPERGGLFIKKVKKEGSFIIPKPSLLGLDKLAVTRRKEREESKRLISFKDSEHDDADGAPSTPRGDTNFKTPDLSSEHKLNRQYRESKVETPSYTGGVSNKARERLVEKLDKQQKQKAVYASSKDRKRYTESERRHDRDRDRDRYRRGDRYRDSNRDRDRYRQNDRSDRSDRSSKGRSETPRTPRFKDEPRTPNANLLSIAGTSWEEEDDEKPSKKSSWDFPTPKSRAGDSGEWSERSNRSRRNNNNTNSRHVTPSPRPTPAHHFNAWAHDRKRSGATPHVGNESDQPWGNEEDKDLWEDEQRRLDREWYNIGEGYDEENNPFSGTSSEYLKKREEQLEQKRTKRISAQQRQINKDNELWERNRMLTSGVVMTINVNEEFDEEAVERVHLLVHHIVPPFLDGRIVFTKQPEPVIPVKDPTSDMALLARKGSALVRAYREQKERRKAQKKHWELGGTKIGNYKKID